MNGSEYTHIHGYKPHSMEITSVAIAVAISMQSKW
jgi:hypothetical protein